MTTTQITPLSVESTPAWIESQPWADQEKVEAHRLFVSRCRTNLPVWDTARWSKWAACWGVAA